MEIRCLYNLMLLCIFFVFFSCDKKSSVKPIDSNFPSVIDTISFGEKQEIKNELFVAYSRLSTNLFDVNDGIDYSNYVEFINLKAKIIELEDLSLDNVEIQRLGILKAKSLIKVSKYSKAIHLLQNLPESDDFFLYKKLLIAIATDYSSSGNISDSYDEVLSLIVATKPVDCNNYVITLILSEKDNLNACEDHRELLNSLKKMGKNQLIKEFILGTVEL